MSSDTIHNYGGIILAAGFSSRMGRWKPAIELNGIPVIIHTIMNMQDACSRIAVVGGHNFDGLTALLTSGRYAKLIDRDKTVIVKNEDFVQGMLSSVKKGLEALQQMQAVFIMPGDIPFVKKSTFSKMARCLESEEYKDVIIPAFRNDESEFNTVKGHPVLFRRRVGDFILSQSNTTILRDLLKSFSQEILIVEDRGICFDIDDEIDLAHAIPFIKKNSQL